MLPATWLVPSENPFAMSASHRFFMARSMSGGSVHREKYLSVQGQREREAVKDFRRRQRAEVPNAEIDIDELIADDAERARDHALQRAEPAEAARGAALC